MSDPAALRQVTAISAQPGIVVAVPPPRFAALAAAVERLGGRADSVADGAAMLARIDTDWAIEVLVLDLSLATPELLARLGGPGATPPLIAIADAASADTAGMLLGKAAAFLPAAASDAELDAALHAALAVPELGVADRSPGDLMSIGALSREVERIAAQLAHIAASDRETRAVAPPVTAAAVRQVIKARRLRERYFPAELFYDPAWDMLLDLTAARLEGSPVSVSSLCIAAAVPTTTALRWIRNLCEAGLFDRRIDPGDARRVFISLSDATADAMLGYLASTRPTAGV